MTAAPRKRWGSLFCALVALAFTLSFARPSRADEGADEAQQREKLERVRNDPRLANDAATIDALVRDAESFRPGPVRVACWVLAAEAYANRLDRPRDAEPLWRRIAIDPHADVILARKANRDLVTALLARGDYAGATDVAATGGDRADPKLTKDVARAVRRHRVHIASIIVLVVTLAFAARAWIGAARRGSAGAVARAVKRTAPLMLAYALYVAIGGALLASGYEAGTSRPFLLFGAALLGVLVLARAWAAAGAPARNARAFRAVLAATSALGAAFLVLESVDVAYLEGIGL